VFSKLHCVLKDLLTKEKWFIFSCRMVYKNEMVTRDSEHVPL